MLSGGTRVAPRPCIWRFRIPDVAVPAPRLRVKNRRKSYGCFLATELALQTKTPLADPSTIASRPTGFTPYSGRLDHSCSVAVPRSQSAARFTTNGSECKPRAQPCNRLLKLTGRCLASLEMRSPDSASAECCSYGREASKTPRDC